MAKSGVITMKSMLVCMHIGQITATVSGGLQFSSYTGLPFKQHHLDMFPFRSCNSRSHTGSTGTNNSYHHSLHLLSFCYYTAFHPQKQEKTSFLPLHSVVYYAEERGEPP